MTCLSDGQLIGQVSRVENNVIVGGRHPQELRGSRALVEPVNKGAVVVVGAAVRVSQSQTRVAKDLKYQQVL